MQNKQPSKIDNVILIPAGRWHASGNPHEPALIAFLDTLDIQRFLYEPAYRQKLNDLLGRFSDEEFEVFERLYAQRFTVN